MTPKNKRILFASGVTVALVGLLWIVVSDPLKPTWLKVFGLALYAVAFTDIWLTALKEDRLVLWFRRRFARDRD